MARILIGNIKGPQGEQGPQGVQGPVGPQGPQGPLPPLVNNALATEAGVSALDAAMGKTLQEQITNNKNDITELNSNTSDKVSKTTDNTINSKNYFMRSVGLNQTSYRDAGLCARVSAGSSSWARPGIGFEREGVEGAFLYYENEKMFLSTTMEQNMK